MQNLKPGLRETYQNRTSPTQHARRPIESFFEQKKIDFWF